MASLTGSQTASFNKHGFIHVPGVFDPKYVRQIQNEIWCELEEEFGIKKTDKTTWRNPPRSPKKTKYSPTNENLINPLFRSIIGQLIGENNWNEPSSWGGFLINFPDKPGKTWDLHRKLWHWDNELFREPEHNGLLIFSFFSEVKPRGGGTLLVSGSHLALRKYKANMTTLQQEWKHGDQRKHFMCTHPYFKLLTEPVLKQRRNTEWFMENEQVVSGIPLRVVELTGSPGDVVFCHPRIIHAPAGINLNDHPRIMRTKFLW